MIQRLHFLAASSAAFGLRGAKRLAYWAKCRILPVFAGVTVLSMGLFVAPAIAQADTQPSHFVWTVTTSNASGAATIINNGATNGDPSALLFVTPNFDPGGAGGGVYDNSPIAVQYIGALSQWVIFNEDNVLMPVGVSFNVLVVPAPTTDAFTLTANSTNINTDTAFINNSATNGQPDEILQATQVYNGVVNDNTAGLYYFNGEWGVFNEGDFPMVSGTKYNVLVGPAQGGKTALLKGNKTNIGEAGGAAVSLGTNKVTAGDSNAFVLDTPVFNPKDSCVGACVYETSQTGTAYFPNQANIFNESAGAMAVKTCFDLLLWSS